MTPEELVEETIDAFNRFDREAVERLCTTDFVMVSPMGDLRGHPYRGHSGAHQWLDDLEENFDSLETTVDEIREVRADRFLVLGEVKVEGKTSGMDYEQRVGWVLQVRDGRIGAVWMIVDPQQAEQQAKDFVFPSPDGD